jgi:DNA-binding response OmpR family regulator
MASNIRVLCVDDNEQLLDATKTLLECKGYEVAAVSTGQAAVDQISKQFDLVIVDYNLPDINGDVVAAQWKHQRPSVPILMLSGAVDLPVHALDHVNAFVAKGSALDSFFGAISELTKAAH